MDRKAKPMACGHGSRHRNKRGCVKCRRENGATLGKPFKSRHTKTEREPSEMERAIRESGLVS